MKILIDTNIILDILLAREPFIKSARQLIQLIDDGTVQAYITANSITDIVYIAKKSYSTEEIRSAILALLDQIGVVDVCRSDILAAFDLRFRDFEDALQSACAEKEQMEWIVTRNVKDFADSKVKAVEITDFLTAQEKNDA